MDRNRFIQLSPFEKTYLFTKSKPVNDCQFGLSFFVVSHLRNKQNKKGSLSETNSLHLKMDETGRLSFLGGGFKYFLFSPRTLGKMNPFWRAYFSDGWFNDQLAFLKRWQFGLNVSGANSLFVLGNGSPAAVYRFIQVAKLLTNHIEPGTGGVCRTCPHFFVAWKFPPGLQISKLKTHLTLNFI